MSFLVSLIVLSALIFFHELGHYIAAKLMGVKVEVFSIGFGKRFFTFKKFDTEWSISAIPLGGYVKMKGQDDTDPTKKNYDEDSYNTKTPLQKIFILVLGPLANFVLAFFLYFVIALGSPLVLSPVIGDISPNSPAKEAGLKSGDVIKEINSIPIKSWDEMSKIIQNANTTIKLKILRDGYIEFKELTPKVQTIKNMYGESIKRKMIGIASAGVTHKLKPTFSNAISFAYEKTVFASTMIFESFQKLLSGDVPAKELGGVISIVKLTSDATQAGWMSVLFFAALISVNLGILNLLPIPALDGGHIMFNLYEFIFHKEASERVVINLTIAGWIILISLMGLGIYNDINRLME